MKDTAELREREQMYLETNQPMRPGKMFSVRLKFEYNLTRGLEGFYISSYKVSTYSLNLHPALKLTSQF